jgi:nifR3 family TIM-barrel protein
MVKITAAVVKCTKLPVTVKTRIGWDEANKNIVDVAKKLQDTGIAAITIHGRTRAQFYTGKADWKLIAEVKNHPGINIPVIGNGDINSPEKAKYAFEQYGVDGIMVGRASIGRPWIFKQIRHYLSKGEHLPEPSVPEKALLAKQQLKDAMAYKGAVTGVLEMRRHMANYFKGLPNFKPIRLALLTSMDPGHICDTLDLIGARYKAY